MKAQKKATVYTKSAVKAHIHLITARKNALIATQAGLSKQVTAVSAAQSQTSGITWDHLKSLWAIDYIKAYLADLAATPWLIKSA